jgi:hypothetical protein
MEDCDGIVALHHTCSAEKGGDNPLRWAVQDVEQVFGATAFLQGIDAKTRQAAHILLPGEVMAMLVRAHTTEHG